MFLICSFLLLLLGAMYYGYRLGFYYEDPQKEPGAEGSSVPEQTMNAAIAVLRQEPFEAISIRSFDGLTLTGRYYHLADNAPIYLQMHGYKGNPFWDFGGTWPIAKELRHNVLLVDQRCHGSSQGHTITFGIKEHRDCIAWAEYLKERFPGVPVMVMGVSMGAATVLMAAGRGLPENVKAVVADCPYDSPENIIRKVLAVEMKLPQKPIYPFIRFGGWLFGGFDLESYSPIAGVRASNLPILLIHGDADTFVPYEMSCRMAAEAPEKVEFHTIPGAAHAMNQVTDPALYRSILVPFAQKHLK